MCESIGCPELLDDARFLDFALRHANRNELLEILNAVFATRTTTEWLKTLEAKEIPCAAVNDVAAALEDPQTVDRGDVVEVEHPRFGTVRQIASPLRIGNEDAPMYRAPFRGEQTAEVLARIGAFSPDEIEELAASGVFGDIVVVSGGGGEGLDA